MRILPRPRAFAYIEVRSSITPANEPRARNNTRTYNIKYGFFSLFFTDDNDDAYPSHSELERQMQKLKANGFEVITHRLPRLLKSSENGITRIPLEEVTE